MRDIVYFSSIPWAYFRHRQQEMMSWFAGHDYRVFFWEPTCSDGSDLSVSNVSATLCTVRSRGLKYERGLRLVNRFNAARQRSAFERLCEEYSIKKPVIWFDRVHGVDADFYLENYACVYDLIDEITAFGRFKNTRMLLSVERFVVERCDVLVTSSYTLGQRKVVGLDRDPWFIPNGIDASRFAEHEGCDVRSKWTVGFCGTISRRRIDIELLDNVAGLLPGYFFKLYGPVDDSAKDLSFESENIEICEAVKSDELPRLLETFSVGLIPYRLSNDTMDYVFPKKAIEYMAAGLPVVSTSLPECLRFAGHIVCVDEAADFADAVRIAAERDSTYREAQRRAARGFTWDKLLPELSERVSRL